MPYFRWIGAASLLAASVVAGLVARRFFRYRYEQAMGYLSLLQHIKRQIDCFSAPIGQILAACDPQVLVACGAVGEVTAFSQLLEAELYLDEEICLLLRRFSAELGRGYREDQLRCCDYYIARLSPYCDKLREDLPRYEKMALLLPPALAAITVLMLL